MDQADYAVRVFQQHFAQSRLAVSEAFVGLELGPGDSLASAVIAAPHRLPIAIAANEARYDVQAIGTTVLRCTNATPFCK
jgi:hypothetical protein